MRVYDPGDSLSLKHQIREPESWIMELAFDPAAARFACGNDRGQIWICSVSEDKPGNPGKPLLAMPRP